MTSGTVSRSVAGAQKLRGELRVPGDKSITHRALMFNAFAVGHSRVDGFLDAADTRSTIACLRALGAVIEEQPGGFVTVEGHGRSGMKEPSDVLDCGNAGTTMRLLAGIVAGLKGLYVLTGDDSLRGRTMARVVQPLNALGARISARAEGRFPPLVIEGGQIIGGQTLSTEVASAQVKSALLLAGLAANGPTTIVQPAKTRDHTERLLTAMGADIEVQDRTVVVTPSHRDLESVDVSVPGDISTAAGWIVAATVHPDAELLLQGVGVNTTRSGIIEVLRSMGAVIEFSGERTVGGEPVADLFVRSAVLHGVEVGGDLIPRAIDELPLIALAGACADGDTVIHDAEELRVKESDRIATTSAVLRAFGVEIEERRDGFRVVGGTSLRPATVDSASDHRVAMLGAIAGLLADGETTVTGADAVSVSYPAFWSDLSRISGD